MACLTCTHTMQMVGGYDWTTIPPRCIWWCPRCGTVRTSEDVVHVPALVERCRKFEPLTVDYSANLAGPWHALGIREAIHPPEGRTDDGK
jgi:hypothetical protein